MNLLSKLTAIIALSILSTTASAQIVLTFSGNPSGWGAATEDLNFDITSDVLSLNGTSTATLNGISGSFQSTGLTDSSFSIGFAGFGGFSTVDFSATGGTRNVDSNGNGLGAGTGLTQGEGLVITFDIDGFTAANPTQQLVFTSVAEIQNRDGQVWELNSLVGTFSSSSPISFSLPVSDGEQFAFTNPNTNQIRIASITIDVIPIPEPSSASLLLAGLAATLMVRRHRRRRQ
ncbi:MAG: PEP-CTERM sorting domain-containing protein [Verrucomicrobiota bacterium]